MSENPARLKCPQCGKAIVWSSDYPFRPFCCERCRLIDLGQWFMEENRIAAEIETETELAEFSELAE
jgi:endogenous inhibitor of DNA gyrase (YacG/DUF329 family)